MAWEIEEITINQENNDNTSPQWEIEDVNPMTQSVMDDRDQKVYNVPVSMDGIDATYAIDTQHRGADASNYFGKVEIVDKAAQSYLDNLKNSANPILALAGKVAEPVSEAGFAMQDANNPLRSIGRGALEPVDLVEDWAYSNIAKRKIKTEIESRQLKEGKISWWDVALRPDWLPNESVADELAAEMKKYRQGLKDIQAERKNKILPQEQMNEADQVIEGMFGALSQTGLSLGSVFVSGNPYAASALIAGMYGQVKKEDVWEEAISQGVNPFAAEVMGDISSIYEAGIEFAGDLVGAKFAKVMPIRNLASQTMQKAAIRLAQKAQAAGADGVIKSASKHLDSIIAGTLKGAAGEYGEEVLQNFGGDLLTNIYGLTQIDLGESFENANIAGLYAAFAGGVAGGGGTALHNRLAKKVNNKLIDTIKQTNPEIKEEEAQIIADGLQEVFYQEDAPEYAKELNKLNSKQIALMKEDKGLSEKNFAAETRKMLKEKYDMTDEQIDQTIKIGVNMIDMRNQYSKAYNYMREELELAGRTPQLADSEARIFAARMSAFARAEGLNLDDLLKERGVKVAQMKFADFMNGKRGKDSKSEMISLEDLQDLRNLKNTKQNSKERTSLLAFIKSKGGMRDSGGELKNMDAHKSYIGVINKNSKLGMDDMALAAWEAGYFEGQERPDINELLAAVKDELMGNPRYSSKDGYEKGQNREQELRELGKELEKIGVDYMNDSLAEVNRKMREAMDEADRMRTQASESEEYNSLNEDQQEQYAILRDRGATHREAMEAVRPSEEMPWFQESLDIAKKNQRLDDIYPAYEGETININGKERTVYNSNGDRIAKSKEALENFYRWFGDSKVVDEQGRPLVVYHGGGKFDTFKYSYDGTYYFTTNKEYAERYANDYIDERGKKGLGELKSVYLKIENPAPQDVIDRDTLDQVIAQGYDGHIFDDVLSENDDKIIRVFEPNQIKSTSNRGTYSLDEDNIYYQFAGEKAQTAALDELDRAKQLEADGVDNEEIRQQTGWFKGVDGKWRFEISDEDADFNKGYNVEEWRKNGTVFTGLNFKLETILKHDKLFDAYPFLRKVQVVYTNRLPDGVLGNYDDRHIDLAADMDAKKTLSVLMHEIQHAIQEYEGFASGGNYNTVSEQVNYYKDLIRRYNTSSEVVELENNIDKNEMLNDVINVLEVSEKPEKIIKTGWYQERVFGTPKGKYRKEFIENKARVFFDDIRYKYESQGNVSLDEYLDMIQNGNLIEIKKKQKSVSAKIKRLYKKAFPKEYTQAQEWIDKYDDESISKVELYRRLYGEIEARNTQARMDMSDEERRAESPESTQDIKNADAIVIFGDGTAMAYEPETYYQSAFAGSRVDYDRPSLEAIGSGEGNQAHGWGLYYALDRDVAEGYRTQFVYGTRDSWKRGLADFLVTKLYRENEVFIDYDDALNILNGKQQEVAEIYKSDAKRANVILGIDVSSIEDEYTKNQKSKGHDIGQTHEVDIPENPYLLDEQKTFAEQSDFVKEKMVDLMLNETLKETNASKEKRNEVAKAMEKWTGGHFYQHFAVDLKSDKAASQLLEKYGIKGITYDGRQDGRCFVIFNPDDVKVIQKFYQGNQSQTGRGGTARGAYSNNIIYLFEHADASTVIHELGHYFLDDLQKYGKSEKSQQQLQAIYNYLGAKDGVITNEMHEYFADSFEVYLKEGKAPNSLLRGVFIKFKNWLRRIFSEVKRLEGVKLTDEMRKTFDEMLGGKSLDFAMQTASENMQLNAKSGYIPPSVADFAIELIHNGKMSRAQMDDILERLKTGDLARADVYKELKAIEAKDEQHGEQLDPFDKVKYKEALLKDNINKGKVLDKIETLMKWAQPRDINGRTVGRFLNKKMNDFFIEANRLMNLEKDEAKANIAENKGTITAILESRELPNEKYSVLGMNFDKEADRPELLNALAIENRLLGVAAKNISLDNAIKLYNDLQDSYNEGRLTANVTGDLKRARKMKMREATIRVLLGDGKVNPKAEKSRVKQFLNRLGTSQMSWGGLMDILSMNDASRSGQSELSQMMDVFQEEQNNAQWVADDGEKFCKFFEAKLQGANNGTISVSKYINNELDKKTKLQWGKYSRTFTKDELIDIYMKSKDMETKEIMLHDEINGFDQGFLDLVNQNLNADDRAFADALFEFYNDNWAKINAFYEEKYGVTMPKNNYYSPRTMLREGISVSDGSPAFASSGFTKKRTAGKGASIDIQGAFRVWNNYVTNTNRWLAWSDKLMDINSVFGTREIKNIIANQWGDNMNSRIRGEIERMAGAKGDKFSAAFSSKLMTKIRGNYAKSVLALKPALMIKQLTSFPAYWNEMSAMDFAAGLADFFKHPKEAIEILGNTTLMKTRGTDIIRDFAEISKMDILKGKKGIKWSDAMMLNIKLGDRGAIYMGGWALYKSELKKNLAQGMSEEDAKAKALERFERVTDETQQSGRLSQQSYWQSNPALRMFTMFQSSQNQYLRKEIGAVRGALTGRMDKAQAAKTLFIFHVLLPCLFQFASDGFDWDKEAQLRAAVLGSLNGVFVLNSLLTKIYDRTINQWLFDKKPQYGSDRLGVREIVPFWASIEDLEKQFEKLADDDIDLTDMADAFEMFSKIAKPAGELAGLPLKYPLDVIKNFGNYAEEDKYRKELLLYLGWSPYALRENDNKIELLDF